MEKNKRSHSFDDLSHLLFATEDLKKEKKQKTEVVLKARSAPSNSVPMKLSEELKRNVMEVEMILEFITTQNQNSILQIEKIQQKLTNIKL